ncbi:hypothetical protein HZH66_013842 [Vespula vulgaris]|uniref:Uncharacterized protein n=1 Tax=Vespula vulgaris TaxID=7454 RepID=A0A834J3W1_VESVU|nr:hypothetical protein HZH66_013842 [Vespula vulgaris]
MTSAKLNARLNASPSIVVDWGRKKENEGAIGFAFLRNGRRYYILVTTAAATAVVEWHPVSFIEPVVLSHAISPFSLP